MQLKLANFRPKSDLAQNLAVSAGLTDVQTIIYENSARIAALCLPRSGTSPNLGKMPFIIAPGDNSCTSPDEVRTETNRFCGCCVKTSISFNRPKAICAACSFSAILSIEYWLKTPFIIASSEVRFFTRWTLLSNFGFCGKSGWSRTSLHNRSHSR